MSIQSITISQLKASAENPRKTFDQVSIEGLAQSIKTDGLLQNLVVAKPKGKQKFKIISGERRFRALQVLLDRGEITQDFPVSVEVREGLTEQETLRIATVENVQRENLPPVEEAEAIATLLQDGMAIDDVAAQTGLSISTLHRRLALSNLCPDVKKALSAKEITLSQAEALTLGTHEQQLELLDEGFERMDAEQIKERLTEEKASVDMAIFPKELYTGTYTSDLFVSDATTYFDDTAQFLELQKQAVEKLAGDYKAKGFEPVVVEEGYDFQSWQYRPAKEGEKGGVVIEYRAGRVEIHENIVSKAIDRRTTEATAGNPFAKKNPVFEYPRPLCEYIAMHKSVAVQKALFDNPRVAKEVSILLMLGGDKWTSGVTIKAHRCLSYFAKDKTPPLALRGMEELARTLLSAIGVEVAKGRTVWDALLRDARRQENLYAAVKTLPDDRLNDLHLFLTVLCFGQDNVNFLDANDNSLFNLVAKDLNVDMRDFWTPDEAFLKRRNKAQLEKLLTDSGAKKKFASLLQGKKAELVKKLAKYFQSLLTKKSLTDEEQQTRNWLPEAMLFPAIDPDAAARQQEPEAANDDFSGEDGEEEEALSDGEDLSDEE
ncbi:MAG: ParB/RepB/Spo0J family partition protein [Pseudomonadota bacterium]